MRHMKQEGRFQLGMLLLSHIVHAQPDLGNLPQLASDLGITDWQLQVAMDWCVEKGAVLDNYAGQPELVGTIQ
jgi:hypothetical protein